MASLRILGDFYRLYMQGISAVVYECQCPGFLGVNYSKTIKTITNYTQYQNSSPIFLKHTLDKTYMVKDVFRDGRNSHTDFC